MSNAALTTFFTRLLLSTVIASRCITTKASNDSREAAVGDDVSLQCLTSPDTEPADWFFSHGDGLRERIVYKGVLLDGAPSKYSTTNSGRSYTLNIKSVTTEDSGEYTCIEDNGIGDIHSIHLRVLASFKLERPLSVSHTSTTTSLSPDNSKAASNNILIIVCVVVGVLLLTIFVIVVVVIVLMRKNRSAHFGSLPGEYR